jgi:endogenous inhibitor of DNA gyrase (YacG/DUF329 family)
MYDFGDDWAQTYTEECASCGQKVEVSTQPDKRPEGYTTVYVKCSSCGKSVEFTLPVN